MESTFRCGPDLEQIRTFGLYWLNIPEMSCSSRSGDGGLGVDQQFLPMFYFQTWARIDTVKPTSSLLFV